MEIKQGDVNGPVGPWTDRVRYSDQGYAFRPNELLCAGKSALEGAVAMVRRLNGGEVSQEQLLDDEWLLISEKDFDVEFAVAELRRLGLPVDPNHVVFSHGGGCGCMCCGSGATTGPGTGANPFFASSVGANPFFASPFFASPFFASPFFASDYQRSGERPSSARPAKNARSLPAVELAANRARAFILDTGIAADLPPFLDLANHVDADPGDRDHPDESNDGFLDPASGHGTFIAGILERLAPTQDTHVCRVLSTFGDGDAGRIARRLNDLLPRINDKTVINLSFGGYADVEMPTLARAIRWVQQKGAVVVASAGNDGVCRPTYPAALPGVIGVGSIEAQGRAYYSNFGPWVRACAPGTDLISAFFNDYNGKAPAVAGVTGPIDPDHYREWARWTGTSFAAPVVAAVLLRHVALTDGTADEAVAAIIDAPGLLRLPGLGTVVNVSP